MKAVRALTGAIMAASLIIPGLAATEAQQANSSTEPTVTDGTPSRPGQAGGAAGQRQRQKTRPSPQKQTTEDRRTDEKPNNGTSKAKEQGSPDTRMEFGSGGGGVSGATGR
jgi:hypothetical protein